MAKKYTFMFFSTDRLGKVRTLTLGRPVIIVALLFLLVLAGGFGFSVYSLNQLRTERSELMVYNSDSLVIQDQLEHYTSQIQLIANKITELDTLEYRIRDLVALQEGNVPLRPVAVGGREVDLLREYATAATLNELTYFDTLDSTLQQLSYEVEQKEINLSELASSLEEKRLVMLYTPTVWPLNGWLSSIFGYRISPFSGRQTFHEGIDIAARIGTEVSATAKGTVIFAGPKSGFGQMVTIDHGYGYITRYGHNSTLMVKVGDKVEKGQVIAKVGSTGQSTGPHLHYEVRVGGIPVNPLKFIIEDRT